ncbi:MAG: ABC transporter permease, partial [Rhodocyclaceae bacterium]|nr:ABC transporter permease [Rhodocyclaceae bacterium]
MIRLLPLALASLWNRRLTAGLTVIVVALSVSLLLGVERLRNDARESFASTVSRTDLIVGARSGPVQLLLYSVFHIGDATNEVSWPAVQRIAARQEVAWVVPLSLGDSHRGFRVVGTTPDFFRHYRYGDGRRIGFAAGRPFADVFEAVVGAEV